MRPPRTFLYSDTHFGHEKVIMLENRPFKDLQEMEKALIKNWNQTVQPNDIIYFLGDFSFSGVEKTRAILSILNGRKILIIGNHDLKHSYNWWFRAGFTAVADEMVIRLNTNIRVKLCHYPYLDNYEADRYTGIRPQKSDLWLIHGHTHGLENKVDYVSRSISVSCENWNYKPVDADTIIDIINKASDLK